MSFLFLSFSDPYLVKRISDKDFRYEFYTTPQKIKPKTNKTYYWFKGGLIHNAQAGISGELLDGDFTKMFHSNQLAEQGKFKLGVKHGFWKTWHENGKIATTQYWNKGLRTGIYNAYNREGLLLEKGEFRKNLKHGIWVDFTKKDTSVFKNGSELVKEKKPTKEEKAIAKEERKNAKKLKKQQPKTGKSGFLKRLFMKKESKKKLNG